MHIIFEEAFYAPIEKNALGLGVELGERAQASQVLRADPVCVFHLDSGNGANCISSITNRRVRPRFSRT